MEVGLARSLVRKRIVVSENAEDSSPVTPMKRGYSAVFNFDSDISLLENLPQDILIQVLSGVDHDDLKHLFHVSKIIREATQIVKEWLFKFSTPKKNNDEFETPNAPMMTIKRKSRMEPGDTSVMMCSLSDADV